MSPRSVRFRINASDSLDQYLGTVVAVRPGHPTSAHPRDVAEVLALVIRQALPLAHRAAWTYRDYHQHGAWTNRRRSN